MSLSLSAPESPRDPLPGTSFVGTAVLGVVGVWLLTVACWSFYPARPTPDSVLAQLTDYGKSLYLPDYDLLIYAGGFLCALFVGLLCSRLARSSQDSFLNRQFWMELGLAASCVAASAAAPGTLSLAAGLVALVGVVFFVYRARRKNLVKKSGSGTKSLSPPARVPSAAPSSRSERWWAASLALLAIAGLVYIPDMDELTEIVWQTDVFHHWSYFTMGPALGFRHGQALGTECYTQYGVGWPILTAAFGKVFPLSFQLVLGMGVIWGCIYCLILFWLLLSLTGRPAWSLFGLLLAIFLHLYCGLGGAVIWRYPSSTMLRAPLDVVLFLACLYHSRDGSSRWGWLIGALSALCLLFGTDTGIYLNLAVGCYCLLLWRYRPQGKPWLTVSFLRRLLVGFVITTGSGLVWASRGSCLQWRFWRGYLESVLFYGGGFSALPMRDGIAGPVELSLALAMLTIYTLSIVNALYRFSTRALSSTDCFLALLSVYGLGAFVLFINRSHPYNLYHVTIPFCILLTVLLATLSQQITLTANPITDRFSRALIALPWMASAVISFAFLVNPNYYIYPSITSSLLRARAPESRPPNGQTTFAQFSRQDKNPLLKLLAQLSQGGTRSIALVQPEDTVLLVVADLPPHFRYSPLILVNQFQVKMVRQTLAEKPPDIVILCPGRMDQDQHRIWTELLKQDYFFSQKTHGWDLYVRRAKDHPTGSNP